MKTLGGGGRKYSSYSFLTSAPDWMSGQSHAPAALYPPGKGPPVPTGWEAGWASEPVWTQRLEEKSAGDQTPFVHSVVRLYTAWSIPAPLKFISTSKYKFVRFLFPICVYNALSTLRMIYWKASESIAVVGQNEYSFEGPYFIHTWNIRVSNKGSIFVFVMWSRSKNTRETGIAFESFACGQH
jgi:hypothetical protein